MAKADTKDKPAVGGTYVYDEKLGRVIQVSKDIPKVASKKGAGSSPCGEGACGPDAGGSGGGCCGGGACQR